MEEIALDPERFLGDVIGTVVGGNHRSFGVPYMGGSAHLFGVLARPGPKKEDDGLGVGRRRNVGSERRIP